MHATIFSLSLHHLTTKCRASAHIKIHRGVEQLAARRAHNPEVAGSSPAPATQKGETKMFLLFFVSGSPRLYLHSLPSVPSLWEREGLSNHSTKRISRKTCPLFYSHHKHNYLIISIQKKHPPQNKDGCYN